jgi:hypothetical protein
VATVTYRRAAVRWAVGGKCEKRAGEVPGELECPKSLDQKKVWGGSSSLHRAGLLSVACWMTTLLCPSRVAAQLPRITTEELTLAAPRVEASADADALVYDMRVEDRWEGGNLIASQEHSIRLGQAAGEGHQHGCQKVPLAAQ